MRTHSVQTLCSKSDSYKHSHYLQIPNGTSRLLCYLAPRFGKFDETTWYGLQGNLKYNFSELNPYGTYPLTMEHVRRAGPRVEAHGEPFNWAGWTRIVERHGGHIPMRIRALREGTTVPTGTATMTCESTDPELAWVADFFEAPLERVWYPSTVATQGRAIKRVIRQWLRETSDLVEEVINFKLHDFGARGVSSGESAAIGDSAHLVYFEGTDTMEGLDYVTDYYNHPGVAGFSIPAMEHLTVTIWGKEMEYKAYENMLDKFTSPGAAAQKFPFIACVSDSYDIDNAVENIWSKKLRQKVMDCGSTIVIRPDSGEPKASVVGTLRRLEKGFGTVTNSKGYKVLKNVAVIQGDGINFESIDDILTGVAKAGFSTSNVAFGSGGALLQKVHRDLQGYAYKGSDATINGDHVAFNKDPITDPHKASEAGWIDTICLEGKYKTVVNPDRKPHPDSAMVTIWEDGKLLVDDNFTDIRKRAAVGL
jgi:nicotinamide phosphoribosyltransferase